MAKRNEFEGFEDFAGDLEDFANSLERAADRIDSGETVVIEYLD